MPNRPEPSLLLLHGFPMDARMWRHVVAHFGPKRRVIAPSARDLIASGATMPGMAAVALSALDSEAPGETAVVVGLSMGGYIAVEFAHAYPERLAALVLCDTRASAETSEGRANRDKMIAAARAHGVAHATAPLVEKLLHDPSRALKSEVDHLVDDQNPEVVIACIEALRDRSDHTETIRRLGAPLVVIAGEYDALAPPDVEAALAALNPGGKFVPIRDSGHVPPLENPEAFNAALDDFLRE
jgi:3-oxoadipate enol-lactonase